jgi:hypothetical protein
MNRHCFMRTAVTPRLPFDSTRRTVAFAMLPWLIASKRRAVPNPMRFTHIKQHCTEQVL